MLVGTSLNFISIDKTNLALYYYKIVQMEFEYLKYYWIKNNRVVLGGGMSSVINITEDDQLTPDMVALAILADPREKKTGFGSFSVTA